jgi:hypothetical protein
MIVINCSVSLLPEYSMGPSTFVEKLRVTSELRRKALTEGGAVIHAYPKSNDGYLKSILLIQVRLHGETKRECLIVMIVHLFISSNLLACFCFLS